MNRSFRIYWKVGNDEIIIGTDIANACRRAGISDEAILNIDSYEEMTFLAVIDRATGKSSVIKLADRDGQMNLVSKIDVERKGRNVIVTSPTKIGITLEVGGMEKMFMNGDQVDRLYRAFDLEADAKQWINNRLNTIARLAV